MTTLRSIVLASASPRRLELLRALGLDVDVVPSAYEEPPAARPPAELARLHARAKLERVRALRPTDAVVAADTVVDVDGRALGKPHDREDASRMLRLLSGRSHLVHSAYALGVPESEAPIEGLRTTEVRFHALQEDEIARYVATGEPMDKAGAYGIQGRAAALIDSIDGDYFTVMGFPLGDFIRALRRLGFSLPTEK